MAECHDTNLKQKIEKEPAESQPVSESRDDILGIGF